jgi:ubiquinone/menaquinone biosynthesis C-methylase UbiE
MIKVNEKVRWEEIYSKFGENLPWCIEKVPTWFKGIIKSGWVKPCKTLDVGCGIGNYAKYLAKQGFDIAAIDLSKKAVTMAHERNSAENIKFKVCDAFKLKSLKQKFGFIYEISLLHNIKPNKREKYVKGLYSVLNHNGKLLICSFSKNDWLFRGKDSLYFPELNNIVYPLSKEEFYRLFSRYFKIDKLKRVYFGRKNKRRRERFICLMTKK